MSGPYGGALFSATATMLMTPCSLSLWTKIVVGNKEVIIISDRHPALLRSVHEENFSSFLSKHNTRGNKGKENALQFLDSIAYGRHHSICNFLLEHMSKLASMLVKHQEESKNWKGCIGPKIEAKVQENIAKGAVYPVTPFMNGVFGVCIGRALLNVDILNRTCTCRGWRMLGIPCEHAIAVIISIGQNVLDFVDDCYKYPMQELTYGDSFSGIETHDMPLWTMMVWFDLSPGEKHQAITDMGFGGLLTFACRELRYELCGWLISQYDFTYHRLKMAIGGLVNVNEQHVTKSREQSSNRTFTLRVLEQNLDNRPLDDIREYWQKHPTYIRGCLMFLLVQSRVHIIVEVTRPLATAWSDDVIKHLLAAEISTFGGYGHVDRPQSTPHMRYHRSLDLHRWRCYEVIEARISETSETMLRLALSLVRDVEASLPAEVTVVIVEDAEEGEGAGGSGSQAPKPSSMKRYKRTAKRIVKRLPACKSPFVAQCVKQFPKIPHADRVVADYALAEMGDPSEILCDMYGMYITRSNFLIVAIVSRMMNGQQALPLATLFEPSFSVVSSNLKSNATTQVILERCAMYLDPDTLGHDLSSCDMMFIPVCENNHWHVHVVNFATGRVEILSSLPLRRGNNISAATRRLSMALHKALHAYRIHMDADVSSFVHVQPHLLQQLNGADCGVLVLKFMEFWNGQDKHVWTPLVLQLVLNERNVVRDTIMAACHL
ncbi:hypothetical protein AAG906_000442 [Vitis piasezkii]